MKCFSGLSCSDTELLLAELLGLPARETGATWGLLLRKIGTARTVCGWKSPLNYTSHHRLTKHARRSGFDHTTLLFEAQVSHAGTADLPLRLM